jgi:hypothetical protein
MTERPISAIDHDSIFKQMLSEFFVEFLSLFAPDALALLEQESLIFLDKESFVDLIDPDRREADLVVQARWRGQATSFIVHLEHQAQEDAELDRRMFRYFARFYDRYDMPIYPIALCSYASPRRAAKERHHLAFPALQVLDFHYRVVQLNRLDWRAYLRHPNPLAAALMARMHIAPRDRRRVKLECLTELAGLPLEPRRKRMIGAFISTYLKLTPTEEQQLQRDLAVLHPNQQEAVMELVSEWEVKGQQKVVLRQLNRRFQLLAPDIEARIIDLSSEQLDLLAEALLDFARLDDLKSWLDEHAQQSDLPS